MKVLILTTNTGGPHSWAYSLKKYVEEYNLDIHIEIKSGLVNILQAHLQFHKYDVVHTITPILFNLSKTPIILNFRGNFKKELTWSQPFNIFYYWSKLWFKIYLSPSTFLADKLCVKATIIPNALNPFEYTQKKAHHSGTKLKCVMVSRFDIYEKARGAIDLNEIFENINFPISCDVFGEGVYFKEMKKKCSRLTFRGRSNTLKKDLAKYDVFVYYSHLDNFPNSILDAMSASLPIITNDVGAVKEILDKKSGCIAHTPFEFQSYLENLQQSPSLRKKLGDGAHKRVVSLFSWPVVISKLISFYRGVKRAR